MAHLTIRPSSLSTVLPQVEDLDLWERAVNDVTGKYDYFETYWRPLLPGAAADVIHAMWKITRFDRRTFQKMEDIVPRYKAIAEAAHVGRATVGRVLQRNEAGQFTYTHYGREAGVHIHRWIREVKRRWRVDQATHSVYQTSNYYQVAAIMPPIPAHDELVRAAYERRLAEREDRARAATLPAMGNVETHVAVSTSDPSSSLNMSHQITHPTDTMTDEKVDHVEGELGPLAIRRDRAGQQATQCRARDQINNEATQPSKVTPQSNQINPSPKKDMAAAPVAARAPQTEKERDAQDYAIWYVADKFGQFGTAQASAQSLAKSLILALEALQAPYSLLPRLVKHGHAKTMKGGRNVGNWGKHMYTTTLNLALDAAKMGWDLDAIEAQDLQKWQAPAKGKPSAGDFPQARTHNRAGRNGSEVDRFFSGR